LALLKARSHTQDIVGQANISKAQRWRAGKASPMLADSTRLRTKLLSGGVATKGESRFLGIYWDPRRRRCRAMTSSALLNVETPTAFDHRIRFFCIYPPTQSIWPSAALPPAFPGFPTIGEIFESTAACKARLQGLRLGECLRR
jgi:hypothetical protein